MPKRLTTEEFIRRAKSIYGNKYDYSKAKYTGSNNKITIICKKHGEFKQRPVHHLNKYNGCAMCCGSGKYLGTKIFIKKAKIKHGNLYDYSQSKYKKWNILIKIICPIHGVFKQLPHNHLKGAGCFKCSIKNKPQCFPKSNSQFISEANKIHNNLYDYSQVNYKGNKIKIKILCKKHGIFLQTPKSHLKGSGCPKCNLSKGETKIIKFLNDNNIKYECQKKFLNLINNGRNSLRFDFYIPSKNLLIEYDGIQHYKGGKIFNHILTKKEFEEIRKRDKIKSKYAKNNNIKLLRIPYFQFKEINKILKKFL